MMLQLNGRYTRTWVGGLRYLDVCVRGCARSIRSHIYKWSQNKMNDSVSTLHLIHLLLFVRPVALSGWMDPSGAMLIGCRGNPITLQTSRSVWKCCHRVGVSVQSKAAQNTHRPFEQIWISNTVTPVSDLCLFVFQEMGSSMTSHAGSLKHSSVHIHISECTESSKSTCFYF